MMTALIFKENAIISWWSDELFLKEAIGLKTGRVYGSEDIKMLRYGKVLFMTDQDEVRALDPVLRLGYLQQCQRCSRLERVYIEEKF
jgi:hypothetical protein